MKMISTNKHGSLSSTHLTSALTNRTFLFENKYLAKRLSSALAMANISEKYRVTIGYLEEETIGRYHAEERMIILSSSLQQDGKQIISVYLHEVIHAISHNAGFSNAFHGQYFGLLLAIAYRRTDLLNQLKLYDFSDTEQRWNGKGPLPSAKELSNRLAFIIERSETLAASELSIEHIATLLANEELAHEIKGGNDKNSSDWFFPWDAFVLGACAGALVLLGIASLTWYLF